MQHPTTIFPIILAVLFAVVVINTVVMLFLRRWRHGRNLGIANQEGTSAASAIVTYYAAGHDLINAGSGITDGMRYSMYMTSAAENKHGEPYAHEVAIVYVLDLPFNTQTHLLGMSKSYGLDQLQFEGFLTGVGMARLQPDGGFAGAFDMYAAQGSSFQPRQILDAADMTLVQKYCATHFWELHDSELYFVVTDRGIGDTDFIIESQQFADAIRPALSLANPDAPVVHHEVPYDIYDGPALACPLCRKNMELHDETWFMCADQHGILVTDHDLARLSRHELPVTIAATQAIHHGPLRCPHCYHAMKPVPHQDTKLEIDSCTNCAFSWLDADEVVALTSVGKHTRSVS